MTSIDEFFIQSSGDAVATQHNMRPENSHCLAEKLYVFQLDIWSERRDLNSRPPVPQTGALTGLRYAPNFGPYYSQRIPVLQLAQESRRCPANGHVP